jgi:hypothetical protein
MRFIVALLAVTALAPSAKADPDKPVRVIEITRENAERSAQIIASSKSALIGMPPAGKSVRTVSDDRRNARAQARERNASARQVLPKVMRVDDGKLTTVAVGRAKVQITKPGQAGPIVETYLVPKQ